MNVQGCGICGAYALPDKQIRLDREYLCEHCQKACDMVEDFGAWHRALSVDAKVTIEWESPNGTSGTCHVSRGRLAWEVSAFLRGGFTIRRITVYQPLC